MKKRHLAIIIVVLLIIIGAVIAIEVALDFNKENRIKNEIKEIVGIIQNDVENTEKINEIIDRRVISKGKYKEVEESIKKYYKDLYNTYSNLVFLVDDDNFSNYLTGTNLKEDRPNFIKSKNNLQNSKAQITEYYESFISLLTDEEQKKTYIIDKDLKIYYKDYYLTLTNELNTEEFKNKLKTTYDNAQLKITVYNEALDFLIANKGHWEINEELITFDKVEYNDEYINITDKLKEQTEEE